MKQIQRFRTATLTGKCSAYNAPMIQDDNGGYVRYDSHVEIVRGLEARLSALESMQKSDFFYHAKPIFEKVIEGVIAELVKKAAQTVFTVDGAALQAGMIAHQEAEARLAGVNVACGSMIIGDLRYNNPPGFIKLNVEEPPKVMRVFCTSADDGSHFTQGDTYIIDRHEHDKIRICQDDLVSDLAEDDCWIAERVRGHRGVYDLVGHARRKRARFQIMIK